MSYSLALTQRVNFYVSVALIAVFGIFLTTTILNAINRDSPDFQYLTASAGTAQ